MNDSLTVAAHGSIQIDVFNYHTPHTHTYTHTQHTHARTHTHTHAHTTTVSNKYFTDSGHFPHLCDPCDLAWAAGG